MTTIEINNDFGGSVKFVNENTIKYKVAQNFKLLGNLRKEAFMSRIVLSAEDCYSLECYIEVTNK